MHGKINATVQTSPPRERLFFRKSQSRHMLEVGSTDFTRYDINDKEFLAVALCRQIYGRLRTWGLNSLLAGVRQPGYSGQLEKGTSSKVHLKKINLFKWCYAVFSWRCRGDTEHKHSQVVAHIDILKRTTRGMRKMIPGVKFISSETEQSEEKVNWRDDFV